MINFASLPKEIQAQALSYFQTNNFPAVKDWIDCFAANVKITVTEAEEKEQN